LLPPVEARAPTFGILSLQALKTISLSLSSLARHFHQEVNSIMLDPFSLATGVAGLISLADVVATKGYRYVKAVKDCDEEVKQLMVELDLFGGVLRRLEKIVKEEEEIEAIDVEGWLCKRVPAITDSKDLKPRSRATTSTNVKRP
jgi:hypothetical protein